jgi:predicted phosphodiesterase
MTDHDVMRYAIVADVHGRRRAWRAVLADVASRSVDRVVCLGDYLEAKVPRRRHDPSRRWELASVVRPDPDLWRELARAELVLGNQETRIRELLRPEETPAELAPLLAAPRRRRLGAALCLHGDQLAWEDRSDGLFWPLPESVPRVPLMMTGHTHQTLVVDIGWPAGSMTRRDVRADEPLAVPRGPADAAGGADEPAAGGADAAGGAEGVPAASTLLINVGAAREKPSHWLLYDDAAASVTFCETPR